MSSEQSLLHKILPTLAQHLDARAEQERNQLPNHLRPRPLWPIGLQIVLNLGIAYTFLHLMWNREDYFTEGGPAAVIALTMFLLIASLMTALRYRRRYAGTAGQRWATINVILMIIAFLCLPATIAVFLN